MWVDLDCEYQQLQESGTIEARPATGKETGNGSLYLVVGLLLLSLVVGGVLGSVPGAHSQAQAVLHDLHESALSTWVLSIRAVRESMPSPMVQDVLNLRGVMLGLGLLGLTVSLTFRIFGGKG